MSGHVSEESATLSAAADQSVRCEQEDAGGRSKVAAEEVGPFANCAVLTCSA